MRERVCKNCGGREYKVVGQNMVKCAFCGTLYVDEHASKEEEVLLVGAYEILRALRFEDAVAEFDKILALFPLSFEAHFGKALAKNEVILYTSQKGTFKRPRFFGQTINSISQDEDFKKALSLAPAETAANFQAVAKRIDRIKKAYEDSTSKQNFDVIVCATLPAEDKQQKTLAQLLENLKQSGKSVYFLKPRETENETFRALETAKVFLFFVGKNGGFAEHKHLTDRFQFLISQRKRAASSFILALDESKLNESQLPRDFVFCKSIVDVNSTSFLQDTSLLIEKELESFASKTAKIETVKVERVAPNKKEYVDIDTVIPSELGHYQVENVSLSDEAKIRWIFLSLKNGDFQTASQLCQQELEKDPYNSQLLFAQLMAEKKIKTDEAFFSNISNFTDKEKIDSILRYATKDFAEYFVNKWENLIVSIRDAEHYCKYLLYLAGFKTPNRENFVTEAERVAIETLDEDLIEKVLKCFDKSQVDRFVNFYFLLAQKSDDSKYYQKILELDAGHFQSNVAVFLRHFSSTDAKLSYCNAEEVEGVLKYFDKTQRANFVSTILDLIVPVAFLDVKKAEKQLDFYLGYISSDADIVRLSKGVAQHLQQMKLFTLAEKYISIAISKSKQDGTLYWILIQIKAHCRSDSELIMSDVRIMKMPEWQTLLELSSDAQDEVYAGIVSKNNLFKGKRTAFAPELLDKNQLSAKLKEFLLRNSKLLLELEKQGDASIDAGVRYFQLQLQPFESYLKELELVEEFESYTEILNKIDTRLAQLELSLDASVSAIKVAERCAGATDVLPTMRAAKQISAEETEKPAKKRLKDDKFLKKFVVIFLEFFPLLFSTLLFCFSVFLPKGVFAHFSQEFLIASLIYCMFVAFLNFGIYLAKKAKLTKKAGTLSVLLLCIGLFNLVLFCVGFYLAPVKIVIENKEEFEMLLKNAKYGSFQLENDINFENNSWKSIKFSGKLNGNGHKIENIKFENDGLFTSNSGEVVNLQLNVDDLQLQNVGTFGLIASKNSGSITNCTVSGKLSISTNINLVLGALVGENVGGKIENCKSNLVISISAAADVVKVGGIAGTVKNGKGNGKISQNYVANSLSVFASASKKLNVGGLVAEVADISWASEICQNAIAANIVVEGASTNALVGGLVGQAESASQDNRVFGNINTQRLAAAGFVGGLYGSYVNSNLSQQILHSYTDVNIASNLSSNFVVGSLVGKLGGRMANCFAVVGETVVGSIVGFGGQLNCKVLEEGLYNPSFEFSTQVWKIEQDALPILLWEE